MFSVQRVPKKFSARWACLDRTYEYYLPARVLGITGGDGMQRQNHSADETSGSERLDRFRTAVSAFVGSHAFHNYTTSRRVVAAARRTRSLRQDDDRQEATSGSEPLTDSALLDPRRGEGGRGQLSASGLEAGGVGEAYVFHEGIAAATVTVAMTVAFASASAAMTSTLAAAAVAATVAVEVATAITLAVVHTERGADVASSDSDEEPEDKLMTRRRRLPDSEHEAGALGGGLVEGSEAEEEDEEDEVEDGVELQGVGEDGCEKGGTSFANSIPLFHFTPWIRSKPWPMACYWQHEVLPKGHPESVIAQHYRNIISWTVDDPRPLVPGVKLTLLALLLIKSLQSTL